MVLSAVASLFRCVMEWTGVPGSEGSVVNVLHVVDKTFARTPTDVANDMSAALESWWEDDTAGASSAIDNLYTTTVRPVSVQATRLDTEVGPVEVPIASNAGTIAGTALPAEVAMVVSLATEKRGPRYRGRIYMPPPATSLVTSTGVIGATQVGILQAATQTLIDFLADPLNDLPLVVYSRKFDTTEAVLAASVNNTFDTQRRRGLR
jgi:hypothetical protein